jgi:hypothetical protein
MDSSEPSQAVSQDGYGLVGELAEGKPLTTAPRCSYGAPIIASVPSPNPSDLPSFL